LIGDHGREPTYPFAHNQDFASFRGRRVSSRFLERLNVVATGLDRPHTAGIIPVAAKPVIMPDSPAEALSSTYP
jgi:hypothetical protein